MNKKQTVLKSFAALLVLTLSSGVFSQTTCYPNPPDALTDEIDKAANNIMANMSADGLSSHMSMIVAYAVADALGGKTLVRKLEAYQYLAETARTDKQVGGSPTSPGSTNAIEKPGLVNLLGFAIERGAIQQNVNDTTVTLTSSPYAFVTLAKGDSPNTYKDYEVFNRLGVSATFNLNNKDNVLENVSRTQLNEWSAKVRLTGDRSTRGQKFQDFWTREIKPLIQTRLDLREDIANPISRDPAIIPLIRPTSTANIVIPLQAQITAFLNSNKPFDTPGKLTTSAALVALREMILCAVRTAIYEAVAKGSLVISSETEARATAAIGGLAAIQVQLAAARKRIAEFLDTDMKKGTLSTFGYTNHRVATGSDYSELKLLFERHVNPVDIILNAGVSLYNKPNPLLNQERIRDFNIAFSMEGSSRNPLRIQAEDMSKITYSLTFRYERLKENENSTERKPDIMNVQFHLEFPITAGLSIPVAYTYATATEMSMKKENRFNIGLHLDLDKLYSLARAKVN